MFLFENLSVFLAVYTILSSGSASFHVKAQEWFQTSGKPVKNVAIIGAGPAGASTAYHLNKFAAEVGTDVLITIFERNSYIGGRSITVPAYEDPSQPVELGASIFVEVNKILVEAAEEFGLDTKDDVSTAEEPEILGIWNGDRFVFTQKEGGSTWWDITKLIWKYGLAPIRTQRLMKRTVEKFLNLYEPPYFPFRSLSEKAQSLGLVDATAVTGTEILTANKIGAPFTTDIIQASTRVNYGQNLGLIHGLETMVCMAIEGARQIVGGNWQIFDRMVNLSNAIVHLNTSVTRLSNLDDKYIIETSSNTSHEGRFDAIVLAAPLQFSKIELQAGLLSHVPDEIPYVTLHVTLFASQRRLNGSYFGLRVGEEMPSTILTTLSPEEDPADRERIVGKSGFFSISTLRTTVNPATLRKEYLYKIFSPKAITAEFLSNIFNIDLPKNVSDLGTVASDEISWYYPYVWKSYPYEYPRVTFEGPELARGFYYTSGMESFISTMETSALMGMNVAKLLVDDFQGVKHKNSAVQESVSAEESTLEEL